MGATIVKLNRLKLKKVHFYSLKVNERPDEFSDFITRMEAAYPKKLNQLLQVIQNIGNRYGAIKTIHFKHERNADALPPSYFNFSYFPDEPTSPYGIRLYCAVLSTEVVVLYNGDLKTTHFPNDCPNVARHFHFALKATHEIDKAIREGDMEVSGTDLLLGDGYELDL